MDFHLTLKKPVTFAFALKPFGVRHVTKLPSLMQKERKQAEILKSQHAVTVHGKGARMLTFPESQTGRDPPA